MKQIGWQCPKCGKCWAPWCAACDCHIGKYDLPQFIYPKPMPEPFKVVPHIGDKPGSDPKITCGDKP
jgi:hypothetical protein